MTQRTMLRGGTNLKEGYMAYQPASGYEHALAVNTTRRGPLRFEEGVATDTDIPNDFGVGAYGDPGGDGRGRSFTCRKDPAMTMPSAHMSARRRGSRLRRCCSDFVIGASAGQAGPQFEMELGSEQRLIRLNPAQVND